MTTNLDTLLTQALALVSEDRRGQLADIIEQIVTAAQAAPQKVYVLATGDHLWDIQGVYATREALEDDARRRRIQNYSRGELMVEMGEASHAPQV